MKAALNIEVWWSDDPEDPINSNRFSELVLSLKDGKELMRKKKKEDNGGITMYVRREDGEPLGNRQYYFEGDTIKCDKDNY